MMLENFMHSKDRIRRWSFWSKVAGLSKSKRNSPRSMRTGGLKKRNAFVSKSEKPAKLLRSF
jgi:hypothetical protein